jgi:hypothetical protein
MIQRIATVIVLSATAAAFSPTFAQTIIGTAGGVSSSLGSSSAIVTLPSQRPQGGTVTIGPAGTAGVTAAPSGGGSTAFTVPPRTQPKARTTDNPAPRRAVRNADTDVAERPVTDCLNDAAAEQRSLDDCRQ